MTDSNETLGNVFQALADPTRRAVIQRLGNGPASTKELAQPFDMALPSFMQHLGVLEDSGLITSEKRGRVRTWQIKREQLAEVESWITEQRALWEDRADRLVDFAEALEREARQMPAHIDFTTSRVIQASRHMVWKAWTTPEYLTQWWFPVPTETEILNFDLQPGGGFDIVMHVPGGENMPSNGVFLEVLPQERIVYTTALTAGWRPADSQLTITAIITMADDSDGTDYSPRVLFKNDHEHQKLHEMGFMDDWQTTIQQLDDLAVSLRN